MSCIKYKFHNSKMSKVKNGDLDTNKNPDLDFLRVCSFCKDSRGYYPLLKYEIF